MLIEEIFNDGTKCKPICWTIMVNMLKVKTSFVVGDNPLYSTKNVPFYVH